MEDQRLMKILNFAREEEALEPTNQRINNLIKGRCVATIVKD